jgi:predicted GNAT family acetyltransferase
MPDISQGVIAARGRLLPFGIFKIFRYQRKTKQLNLLLGGIKDEYRGKGLDVILGKLIFESAKKRGFEYIDSHLELEHNYLVRREMERMGGYVYKRYRIYYKPLH